MLSLLTTESPGFMLTRQLQSFSFPGPVDPFGGALRRDPGHDENDSLPGQGLGANLYLRKALTSQTLAGVHLG